MNEVSETRTIRRANGPLSSPTVSLRLGSTFALGRGFAGYFQPMHDDDSWQAPMTGSALSSSQVAVLFSTRREPLSLLADRYHRRCYARYHYRPLPCSPVPPVTSNVPASWHANSRSHSARESSTSWPRCERYDDARPFITEWVRRAWCRPHEETHLRSFLIHAISALQAQASSQ